MNRWIGAALCAVSLFASARSADAFLYVSGSDQTSGDLVAVWVKNGFELIRNLGPVEALTEGQVDSFEVPGEFDGSLVGAKFTALAVPNPDAVFSELGLDPPLIQNNIALTTLNDPATITFNQIADAQSVLDTPVPGQTWFVLLGAIPASGQIGVVSNSDDEALIQTTLFASYTGNVGFSSDAIGNRLSLSTAQIIAEGDGYAIPLYEVFQTVVENNGNYDLGTDVTTLGTLSGDDGSSGNAILTFATPEPAAPMVGAAAIASLAAIARRRQSRVASRRRAARS
jgi:hypothetical protein